MAIYQGEDKSRVKLCALAVYWPQCASQFDKAMSDVGLGEDWGKVGAGPGAASLGMVSVGVS